MKKDIRGSGIIWAIAAVMILAVIISGALTFAYYSYNNNVANTKKVQLELEANSAISSVVSALEQGTSLHTLVPTVGHSKKISITLPDGMTNVEDAYIERKEETKLVIYIRVTSNLGEAKASAYMDLIDKAWVLNYYDGGMPS